MGSSKAITSLRALIRQCADSNAPVLIRGESGVGKELVCRELHNHSPRYSQRLVAINCGAIPAQLLESELFGHKKGAFTGASCDRKGRFELANNGTLFLDEIGDMPLDLQVKFLRVLEERQIEPVGANSAIDIDVRVVAATHRDLTQMIEEGSFREDLYYRLNVIPLKVPRLADRRDDVAELVDFFAAKFAAGRKPVRLSHISRHIMEAYTWPGNVRELSNFVQRLSVLFPGQLIDLAKIPEEFIPGEMLAILDGLSERLGEFEQAAPEPDTASEELDEADALASIGLSGFDDLSTVSESALESAQDDHAESEEQDEFHDEDTVGTTNFESIVRLSETMETLPAGGVPTKDLLNRLEANLIRTALAQTRGNVSHAAGLLQLGRTTVIQKMAKYEITAEELS
ncbi:MAG: sigma-54-dependent Fis family transcriptional regulator [Pseudomonadales bacterium]|nr:sigma-54-dependent Fis family transcriptional regulator [Pseudomonadales bacterium]